MELLRIVVPVTPFKLMPSPFPVIKQFSMVVLSAPGRRERPMSPLVLISAPVPEQEMVSPGLSMETGSEYVPSATLIWSPADAASTAAWIVW